MNKEELKNKAHKAVKHFWRTRKAQHRRQGQGTGKKDAGTRAAVTGGAQLNGFVALMGDLIEGAGANACQREIILNGRLTCRNEPNRLNEWTDMVQQLSQEHA